ncbi:MAG TPA: hypothetical protein VHB45_13085 [Alloacidobacterium sp.]|nr:hypothetical protein [Alloacidobacterium sp.]
MNSYATLEMKLSCVLTDEEVQRRGRALGETVSQIDALSKARTAAMKEFKDKQVGLEEEQRELSRAIRDRLEERMVRCAVQFHAPQEGYKRIVRLDTGEIVRKEPMTDAEKQLNLFAAHRDFEKFMREQGVHAEAEAAADEKADEAWPPRSPESAEEE